MSILLGIIIFYLAVSVLFYVLFGGADFGIGILECFMTQKEKKARVGHRLNFMHHAIAPVWEANHIWLILVVVILFVGFPSVYAGCMTYLHVPMVAILVGIAGRGCAFTFGYYDTLDHRYKRLYSSIFSIASVWTAFFLGVVFGAIRLGWIQPDGKNYFEIYFGSWMNLFCVGVGIAIVFFFGFLAAVYLIGDAKSITLQRQFYRKARVFAFLLLLAVFGIGIVDLGEGLKCFSTVWQRWDLLGSGWMVLCILFFYCVSWKLPESEFWMRWNGIFHRVLAGALSVFLVWFWFGSYYPHMIVWKNAIFLSTFQSAAAPEATLSALRNALFIGTVIIFPGLYYLFRIFKS